MILVVGENSVREGVKVLNAVELPHIGLTLSQSSSLSGSKMAPDPLSAPEIYLSAP